MPALLTADDVTAFQAPRPRRSDYLALENGDFVYLDDQDIATGTPLSHNYVVTTGGTEARILLTQDSITDAEGWRAELDDDGRIGTAKAAEIADGINETSGIALTMAVERAHELAAAAELAAAHAQNAALARAAAVARVVSLCGGNQTEAGRALDLDKSRVSRLVGKAAAATEPMKQLAEAMERASAAAATYVGTMAELPHDVPAEGATPDFPAPTELTGRDVEPESTPR